MKKSTLSAVVTNFTLSNDQWKERKVKDKIVPPIGPEAHPLSIRKNNSIQFVKRWTSLNVENFFEALSG